MGCIGADLQLRRSTLPMECALENISDD